jgi:hypothetical protein
LWGSKDEFNGITAVTISLVTHQQDEDGGEDIVCDIRWVGDDGVSD